jgi:hypothetical protein
MSDAAPAGMVEALQALRADVLRLDAKIDSRFDRLSTETRADITQLSDRLRQTEHEQAAVSAKLDLLTDRIVSRLPTWWQIPAILGSVAAVLTALYAAVQFLRLHGWWPA